MDKEELVYHFISVRGKAKGKQVVVRADKFHQWCKDNRFDIKKMHTVLNVEGASHQGWVKYVAPEPVLVQEDEEEPKKPIKSKGSKKASKKD